MKEPKYCSRCGCYLPELWDICPSCGAREKSDALKMIKDGEGLTALNYLEDLRLHLHPAEIYLG